MRVGGCALTRALVPRRLPAQFLRNMSDNIANGAATPGADVPNPNSKSQGP